MENFYKPGFKFHLYASFENREQAIGLDLIESLLQVNQVLGLTNFVATIRFSKPEKGQEKLPRWTEDYIE